MAEEWDRSSKLKISLEDLEPAKFTKDNEKKIAVRVGNSDSSPLYVTNIVAFGSNHVSIYDNTSNVPKNIETKIFEYTVPPSNIFKIESVLVSGENIGRFTIKVDGVTNKVKRTHYSSGLNTLFQYSQIKLMAGQKIEVYALNISEGGSDFDATLEGTVENE